MKICGRCSELFSDDARFCANDGASLDLATDRFLGRTIASRYRLVRRLGAGGMSLVYLARHEAISRLSALKILRPELSAITEHRERFLREARAVNRINHPNIVEITDVGESDGVAYLVMEYVEGDPLFSWVKRGPLPWEAAAQIGVQISSALARAHQMGIVHRDLKPENILLTAPAPLQEPRPEAGGGRSAINVKLTDFGIAKMFDEPTLTLNEQLFGTPGYIAPEYVSGLPIDGRADIYSLAVVLYELVTGTLPFDGHGASELLLKPLTTSPIPIRSRRPGGYPAELEALLMRCLSREPNERPADAFYVHDALVSILREHGPERLSGTQLPALSSSSSVAVGPPSSGLRTAQATELDLGASGAVRRTGRNPQEALAELGQLIEALRERGAEQERPRQRAENCRALAEEMITRIERAERTVSEQQAACDYLEVRGREFRTDLGYAIDILVHDRSRTRAELDRRRALGAPNPAATDGPTADLDFQIAALQAQLQAKNDAFEAELVEASGRLEGSLSALRQLHREVARTIQDGISAAERALR